jgi:hypothetical protein
MFLHVSPLHRSALAGFALAGFIAASPIGAARAETVPFNEVILYSLNPEGNQGSGYATYYSVNTIRAAPLSPVSEAYDEAGGWGSVAASGSADLAAGQLKMRVGAEMGDGSAVISPYVKSNAIFGDGFRASTPGGTPFNWASDSVARFTLDLSGSMDISGDMTDTFHPGLFIVLSILDPGTLDPNQPLINGPTARQYFLWSIGDPNATVYYQDQDDNILPLTPTDYYDELPAGSLTAEFTPGGDFDWVLFLAASGQVMEPGQWFDYDLTHTLDLAYAGPDGSVTQTVSGQFGDFDQVPPTTTVPEPGTLAVLLGALAMFACARRRASLTVS